MAEFHAFQRLFQADIDRISHFLRGGGRFSFVVNFPPLYWRRD